MLGEKAAAFSIYRAPREYEFTMDTMHVSNRIAVGIVLSITVAFTSAIAATVAVKITSGEQRARIEALLRSELIARKESVQRYLREVAQDLQIIAGTRIAQQGLSEFQTAFEDFGDDATAVLQRLYVTDNPNPPGLKHALLRANDSSSYSVLHARYQDWFSKLASAHDYYDVFLVTAEGDVVYTVYKEVDFATNLLTGQYKDTELAETFRQVSADPKAGAIVFRDFVAYAPSNGLPAAFVGTPMISDGQFLGALLVQLKSERFDELMKYSRIMGQSGETYLVGSDFLMRSRSRFASESTVLKTRVNTPSVKAALANTTDVQSVLDYRGVPVLSAYSPLSWQGVTWAVLAEINQEEVEAPIVALVWWMVIVGGLCSVAAFILGLLLGDTERTT